MWDTDFREAFRPDFRKPLGSVQVSRFPKDGDLGDCMVGCLDSMFLVIVLNAGHEGRGATTLKLKKNDSYSRVPLDAFVVRALFLCLISFCKQVLSISYQHCFLAQTKSIRPY